MRGSIIGGPVEAGAVPAILRGTLRGTTMRGVAPAAQSMSASIVSQPTVASFRSGPQGANAPAYTHVQPVPSDTWTVIHNLNAIPSAVAVLDSAGTVCFGRVEHVSVNQLTLTFGAAFAGTAYLR